MGRNWVSGDLNNLFLKLPKVAFSEWTPFERRNSMANSKFPGVFLIAKFDKE